MAKTLAEVAEISGSNGPVFKISFGYDKYVFLPATPDGLKLINMLSAAPTYQQRYSCKKGPDGQSIGEYFSPTSERIDISYRGDQPKVFSSDIDINSDE